MSLEDAVTAKLERKNAVAGDVVSFNAGAEQLRMLFSGFDVDVDELARLAALVGAAIVSEVRGSTLEIVSGAWLDGVLLGLFLARESASQILDDAGWG